jgi:RES domain-containing protein
VNDIYASEIDEITHSILYSWRYNPKGEFGVLYLSVSPKCAYREKLKQVSGHEEDLLPQAVGSFRVDLARCLDLTNASFREKLGISREQLTLSFDFSMTQSIAREARNLGFEAIIAPSAIGTDCGTLVVFKDKLSPPSYCILDEKSIRPYP